MYCPKCGDLLSEDQGILTCQKGQMELSRAMADGLRQAFMAEDGVAPSSALRSRIGGNWFCPRCSIPMKEDHPGQVRCPKCGRDLGKFIFQLVELYPHK
jgi:uncharacterized Zn finger protein (UPF0148 family)